MKFRRFKNDRQAAAAAAAATTLSSSLIICQYFNSRKDLLEKKLSRTVIGADHQEVANTSERQREGENALTTTEVPRAKYFCLRASYFSCFNRARSISSKYSYDQQLTT